MDYHTTHFARCAGCDAYLPFRLLDEQGNCDDCAYQAAEEVKQEYVKGEEEMNTEWKYRAVKVAGHPKTLWVQSPLTECGAIRNGVAFEFGQGMDSEGSWVVDFDDLKALVQEVEDYRASRKQKKSP